MRLFDIIQAKILLFSTLMAGALSPLMAYFERYVFNDWDYLGFLTSVFIVDTLSGIIKHAQRHTLSTTGFMRVFIKMAVALGALIVTHGLAHFDPQNTDLAAYTETFGHTAVMIYIATSAVRNLHDLSGKKLPIEWLMKRFDEAPKTITKTRKQSIK